MKVVNLLSIYVSTNELIKICVCLVQKILHGV